jgi:hypothetical protein
VTDEAVYQPFPTPHGWIRPTPPSLRVQQGSLPPELVEQAHTRHAEAEVLVLPRAANHLEASEIDGDLAAPVYLDFDHRDVTVLRRAGASVDFLVKDHRLLVELSRFVWIDFAVVVAANVSADTVITIARYLAGRVRHTRQSGDKPQLDLVAATTDDGTFLRATGTNEDAVLKAYSTEAADVDPRGEVRDTDVPESPNQSNPDTRPAP